MDEQGWLTERFEENPAGRRSGCCSQLGAPKLPASAIATATAPSGSGVHAAPAQQGDDLAVEELEARCSDTA